MKSDVKARLTARVREDIDNNDGPELYYGSIDVSDVESIPRYITACGYMFDLHFLDVMTWMATYSLSLDEEAEKGRK